MRKLVLITAVLVMFGGTETAQAHLVAHPGCKTLQCRLKSQEHNLAHVKYVANNGKGRNRTWHRKWVTILEREVAETRAALRPKLSLREWIRQHDPCGYEIIDRETGSTWSTTIDYGGGHGNVYEAYGWPQANPGTKMSSAGKDWRTSEHTQYRWFTGYVNSRYGGSCAALAYHNANHSY